LTIAIPTDVAAPEVSAAASPSQVMLGAPFTLFVTAAYGGGVEVNLPEPIQLGPGFEVMGHGSEDRVRGDGRHVREWQIQVRAWELGDLPVPSTMVTFTVGGRAAQVATNPVPLHVAGVLGDVDDVTAMRGDAAPVSLTSRTWRWIGIAIAAGAAVFMVIAALWLRARRRHKIGELVAGASGTVPVHRIDMTGERALERLLAIERSGVLSRDEDRKRGYAEMVEVVREYLAARYHVVTGDLTSSELSRALAHVTLAEDPAQIERWLERCDLVKYGGHRAAVEDAAGVLADARALVVATTADRGDAAA
jgi:hypothetical protein